MWRIMLIKLTFWKYLQICKCENNLERKCNTMKNNEIYSEKIYEKGNVMASACPSRAILQHITSKWGVLILVILRQGTKRFSELRKEIDGMSERMLAQTLQYLEQDKMIHRQDFQTVPPHVEYTLTPFGKTAADKLYELVDWLETTLPEIEKEQKS